MTSRDEYLDKFKIKLDEWNAEIEKLENRAQEAQADAKINYDKQLASLREMRDEAQQKFAEMQNASNEAWDAMVRGTEEAWQTWMGAFHEARSKFKSKD